MARVYARQIHEGKRTIDQVPERWRADTIDAYFDIYGIHIGE